MKIAAIIVARQTSRRLPGKALVKIGSVTVLELIVTRLRRSSFVKTLIIATSSKVEDDAIADEAKRLEVNCFRGDADDVLNRISNASELLLEDYILEVGGDCPLVDADLVEIGVKHASETNADLVTNTFFEPWSYPVGYDFILIKKKALKRLNVSATLEIERAQPFTYLVNHSDQFTTTHFQNDIDRSGWRWTLDFKEDHQFLLALFQKMGSKFYHASFKELEDVINANPEILEINKMHNEPVVGKNIWYTGSYDAEMQAEILSLLNKYANFVVKKQYYDALMPLQTCESLLRDMIERLNVRILEKSDD